MWLKQNLKVTHYNNGEPIPNVTDINVWTNLTTGAYCDYNNSPDSSNTYGRLYNWYSVNDPRNIAPVGWHVASDSEWTILTDYLGGELIAGGKLKEVGFTHWLSPNTGATNETSFTALPGGSCSGNSAFLFMSEGGLWWTSTGLSSPGSAWFRTMNYNQNDVYRNDNADVQGFSIRCIKDFTTGTDSKNNFKDILIYPNPVFNLISIEFPYKNQFATVTIYNLIGNNMFHGQINKSENVLDLSSLKKGMYILEISATNILFRKKIIKN